jgi:hypothetical protein
VLLDRIRPWLSLAQFFAAATLLRSLAYERWVTVFAAGLILLGTLAAQRNRTWGVALTFMVSVWFPVAALIGIAPLWFVAVGLSAAMPFMLLWRAFAKMDRGASLLFAGLAATVGAGAAVVWKNLAWVVFSNFPALAPRAGFHHGLLVLTTFLAMVAFEWGRRRQQRRQDTSASSTERVELLGSKRFVSAAAEVGADHEDLEFAEPRELRTKL